MTESLQESASPAKGWVVLIPVYNDWAALNRLLQELDARLAVLDGPVQVLAVDDGSVLPYVLEAPAGGYAHIDAVIHLPLRRNLGHQRAIAAGLVHIHQHLPCEGVIIMDSDGEDSPEDVPRLAACYREADGAKVVFAERTRRSERLLYRLGYRAYQGLSWVMTGNLARVGNFSILPAVFIEKLVLTPELWNHYAAAVFNTHLPRTQTPTRRGYRYSGATTMDYPQWVAHGIGAMSTYAPILAARLFLLHLALFCVAAVAVVILLCLHHSVITGVLAVLAAVFFLQASLQLLALVILMLSDRHKQPFLPLRDAPLFTGEPIDEYRRK